MVSEEFVKKFHIVLSSQRCVQRQRLKWVILLLYCFQKSLLMGETDGWTSKTIFPYWVTQRIQNVLSLLPPGLPPPNLIGWWLLFRGFHSSNMSFWSCAHLISRDKIKKVILPLPPDPQASNLAQWCLRLRDSHTRSHMSQVTCPTWSWSQVFLCDKWKVKSPLPPGLDASNLRQWLFRVRGPHPKPYDL